MPTINLRNVEKSYGGNAANAVSDLDLEIGDGEFMCLLGPSGCGKTTTLRMIAGLEHLSGGEIQVGERKVDSVHAGIFIPPEKREMGLVFQSYALWPHLTIERNTDFGLRLRKVPKAEREERVEKVMRTLGIEQFDPAFDGAWLHRHFKNHSAAIKQVLLAGMAVVGVGNIYASESLFRARINPKTPANKLSPARCERLADMVRATLADALTSGGSTLRDYVGATGEPGAYFEIHAAVYEREGLPCRVCATPIRRIVQGQRATYYCPKCQRN